MKEMFYIFTSNVFTAASVAVLHGLFDKNGFVFLLRGFGSTASDAQSILNGSERFSTLARLSTVSAELSE